jgi:hypothetical protein
LKRRRLKKLLTTSIAASRQLEGPSSWVHPVPPVNGTQKIHGGGIIIIGGVINSGPVPGMHTIGSQTDGVGANR